MRKLEAVAVALLVTFAGMRLAGFSVRAAALAAVLVLALGAPAVLLGADELRRRDRT